MPDAGIRVLLPGPQTTVQDLGRPGHTAIGVPAGGAADARALIIGNRLLGNADDAAGIEMTLIGAEFELLTDAVVSLTGAEFNADVRRSSGESGHAARLDPIVMHCGDRVRIARLTSGARAYLCVRGGVAVLPVLGSRSTCLAGAFGGFEGRSLRSGDILPIGQDAFAPPRQAGAALQSAFAHSHRSSAIRVTRGPHVAAIGEPAYQALLSVELTVSSRSNRMGVRLENADISTAPDGRLVTQGMFHGAIQLPPGGEPIILGVDHPTTGGYPIIAGVIHADLHRIGQLRPGAPVRLMEVALDAARAIARDEDHKLHEQCPPVQCTHSDRKPQTT
ncbi:MAG: biotin-dependent carboxyltransferase family protein [Phycisphaerales bacterium]|nr:biotin-dependent carboxyltransferase family protein [Phycisphaerales bacterium]